MYPIPAQTTINVKKVKDIILNIGIFFGFYFQFYNIVQNPPPDDSATGASSSAASC